METQETNNKKLAADLAIVLVHGTFARDAEWVREDSLLSSSICKNFNRVKIVPFGWSGSNSPTARIDAGQNLAKLIRTLNGEGKAVFIVAHSHGGNVALYALRDARIQNMVNGLAFLGTPFLQISRRAVDRFARIISQTASWLLVFPVFLPFGAMALINLAEAWFGALAGGFMLFLGNALALLLYLFFARKRLSDFVTTRLTEYLETRQNKTFDKLAQPVPQCRTLVSWVDKDEAGLLLKAIDVITFAPWQVFDIAVRIMFSCVLSFSVVLMATIIYDETLNNLDAPTGLFTFVLSIPLFVVVAPWLIGLVSSLIRGLPVAFGFEGFLGASTLRISPSSLPWWKITDCTKTIVHTPNKDSKGLRHSSFYDDPKFVEELIEWIAEPSSVKQGNVYSEIEKSKKEEQRAGLYRKWVLPSLSSLVVILVYFAAMTERIKEVSIPKEDIQPIPSEVAPIAENLVTILNVNHGIVTEEEGLLGSRKPIYLESSVLIKPGQTCLFEGQFEFENWDSTINISIHDVEHPDFDSSSSDLVEPNHRKITYDFRDQRIHREIWEWNSGQGKSVAVRRTITNHFIRESVLFVRLWNNSDQESRVKGNLQMACN